MKYIDRHAEKTLRHLAGEFPSVLITGARQTGKSTLLDRYTHKRNIPGITFDDPAEEMSAKIDPKTFMELHPSPYSFDEVQYVPEIFRYLKLEIDKDRRNGMYFLTGSQQFHLMENVSESLSGRIGILQLYPLSAREIRGTGFYEPFVPDADYFRKVKKYKPVRNNIWKSIWRGGFPSVITGETSQNAFYQNYLRTYIERDIRKLSNIGDELKFLQFITAAAARTGNLVNYADLAGEVGVSEVTAKKWLSLLVTSGLVYLLRPFSMNVEKRAVKTPKLYFMDTGLAAHITGWTGEEVLQSGAMSGAFFETYVISEIVKSFCNTGQEPPLYFYRDKDKTEIDLIIFMDNTIYPVEIKKTATPGQRDAKNFYVTNRIKNVNVAENIIICSCDSPVTVSQGVLAIPVEYI